MTKTAYRRARGLVDFYFSFDFVLFDLLFEKFRAHHGGDSMVVGTRTHILNYKHKTG